MAVILTPLTAAEVADAKNLSLTRMPPVWCNVAIDSTGARDVGRDANSQLPLYCSTEMYLRDGRAGVLYEPENGDGPCFWREIEVPEA